MPSSARLAALFVLAAVAISACAGSDRHVESAPAAPPRAADASTQPFAADDKGWGRFHSKRFGVSIPLPDGRAWRIDDHSRPELFATHAPTRSQLVLESWFEPDLMNRQRCEERARARGLAPTENDARDVLRTVSDEVVTAPDAYDTRLWVAIAPGTNESAPLTGHLFAFGAFLRKCLLFHFSTEVPTGKDEIALGDRLAAARVRIFDGLKLDDFDSVPREKSRQ